MFQQPKAIQPGEKVTQVGELFGTPIIVKGLTWLPFTQLVVWGILAWAAGRDHPERSWVARLGVASLTMPVILGSEWAHNLAHAAAAQLVNKPMDALRIAWGMPLLVYHDINDASVTPRQHILRALGGPVVNILLLQLGIVARLLAREGSVWEEGANAAVGMNLFLSTVSLLPIPGIDGGPILKWSLVERGYSMEQADQRVKEVNKPLALVLGGSAAIAIKKKRKLIGFILAVFSLIALAVGWGIISEQET